MLSREKLEEYRRMTPGERLSLTLELSRKYQHYLFKGTPHQVKRRFERMRQAKDESNRRICEALARAERYENNQDDNVASKHTSEG